MQLLILLVVIVGIVAVGQLAKVYELSSRISGHREEDISHADTRLNANLFLAFVIVFFASTAYLYWAYGDYAPPPASAHGVDLDWLMSFHIWIITAVFVLVNSLLFYFAWKYAYDKNRKATFFPHDNRLELIWTVIPSIVLAVIIIYGLQTWNAMTGDVSADALRIEVYSKQFDWTARYAGNDGEFGQSNYNLITPMNPLGILTPEGVEDAASSRMFSSVESRRGQRWQRTPACARRAGQRAVDRGRGEEIPLARFAPLRLAPLAAPPRSWLAPPCPAGSGSSPGTCLCGNKPVSQVRLKLGHDLREIHSTEHRQKHLTQTTRDPELKGA